MDGLWVERINIESNPGNWTQTSCTCVNYCSLKLRLCVKYLYQDLMLLWPLLLLPVGGLPSYQNTLKSPWVFGWPSRCSGRVNRLSASAASSTHLPSWCAFCGTASQARCILWKITSICCHFFSACQSFLVGQYAFESYLLYRCLYFWLERVMAMQKFKQIMKYE